jgi:luciferase family oxidoreductase group 1
MTRFSVLDLVPVREGGTVAEAFATTTQLARRAEHLGGKRSWVAEHHAMEGIAGGATAVVLAHIGNATSRIRIGSGGIMLRNHTPFQIVEAFGTLDALLPGRIDLGWAARRGRVRSCNARCARTSITRRNITRRSRRYRS